ncbi:MAG: prepilin-type N-terminal cleavage/methylation domain-containing protein [Deltaproteobacteria bacterium]|nr:prepilin-type N-terminal cleavage/methylation domain-containing protein [Deltaproteobacteria bacterium]
MILKKNISLKGPAPQGFTLIEMVIALTILALVVMVLYLAFANAGRIWTRQQVKGGFSEHEAVLARLLDDDLQNLVPYSFSWEKGEGFFFAVGPSALFYVTTSGYGARQRAAEGLYFACLYLQESQAKEGQSLYLAKEMGPKKFLVEALWDFKDAPDKSLVVSERLSEASLLVLDGLTNAAIDVVVDPEKLNLPEGELDERALLERGERRNWSRNTLPENLLFRYDNPKGVKQALLLALVPPPQLPGKKDGKKK